MDFVTPKKIASPWSGSMSVPKIKVYTHKNEIVHEAWWYCPDSGKFITKGVIKIEPKTPDTKK